MFLPVHFSTQLGLCELEDVRDEADRAAAFINREIDGDISSSAAGSKKRGEKESWLAARRSVSMTSNMLIHPLHSYMAHTVSRTLQQRNWRREVGGYGKLLGQSSRPT